MKPLSSARALVPVLYVGNDLTAEARHMMLSRRIGVTVAHTPARAERLLSQFRVAAVVFATPDLQGLQRLAGRGTPIIVLAARSAACDLDGVTVLRREAGLEDLPAVIYGIVGGSLSESTRDAA